MAFRISKKYCAGADRDGNYHLINKDGTFGKRIDVSIEGKIVNISAVVRKNGEIEFLV